MKTNSMKKKYQNAKNLFENIINYLGVEIYPLNKILS